jgi:hypothetical protein
MTKHREPSGTGSGNRARATEKWFPELPYGAEGAKGVGNHVQGPLAEGTQGEGESGSGNHRFREPKREPGTGSQRSRLGKRSRRKGAAWQAELARRWRDLGLWICARSTQGEQRTLGALGADVEGTPFAVEAKHRRSAQPIQALRQAEDEAFTRGDERPCIAVVREHGSGAGDAVVCMRLGTFEALAASWRGPAVVDVDRSPPVKWVTG